MSLLDVLILVSSISFLSYGITYFTSPKMESEFVRFGLSKYGILTASLEIIGALGLLVGLAFDIILLISSGGLALLMVFGVAVRISIKDGFWAMTPALLFFILNSYIFFEAIINFSD